MDNSGLTSSFCICVWSSSSRLWGLRCYKTKDSVREFLTLLGVGIYEIALSYFVYRRSKLKYEIDPTPQLRILMKLAKIHLWICVERDAESDAYLHEKVVVEQFKLIQPLFSTNLKQALISELVGSLVEG